MSKEHADAFECGYQMGLAHGRAEHEPIVRCRDCKHSDTLETAPGVVVRCCYRNKIGIPRVVGDDGFCAWGERRDA